MSDRLLTVEEAALKIAGCEIQTIEEDCGVINLHFTGGTCLRIEYGWEQPIYLFCIEERIMPADLAAVELLAAILSYVDKCDQTLYFSDKQELAKRLICDIRLNGWQLTKVETDEMELAEFCKGDQKEQWR